MADERATCGERIGERKRERRGTTTNEKTDPTNSQCGRNCKKRLEWLIYGCALPFTPCHMGIGARKFASEKPHLLSSIALNIFERMNNNNDTITKDALNCSNVGTCRTKHSFSRSRFLSFCISLSSVRCANYKKLSFFLSISFVRSTV